MPSVRPRTSWLPWADLSHTPSCIFWVFSGSRRARAMISPMTSSTTLRVLEYGALNAATPRSAATRRSIWLVPMQNAPTARRSGALPSTFSVTLVLERTPSSVLPWTASISSSSDSACDRVCTTYPWRSKTSLAAGWMFSRRRTSGVTVTDQAYEAGPSQVGRIHDAVGVALLGEEALPVLGEVGVDGVAADDGVEARRLRLALRSQQATEALCLLLPGAEAARDLDRHGGLGEVDGEVRHLRHHEQVDLALAEGGVEPLALLDRRLALDHRRPEVLGELVELVEVLPDHQGGLAGVLLDQPHGHQGLGGGAAGQAVPLLGLGRGVGQALSLGQGHPDLDTVGWGDPPLGLDVLPG